jgi:hypothetical protein
MSWDVDLTDDRGHNEGQWNYTHNCNGMIAVALERAGVADAHEIGSDHPLHKIIGAPWWKRLDGQAAREMGIKHKTVNNHLNGAYNRLGVQTLTHAVLAAGRAGVIDLRMVDS